MTGLDLRPLSLGEILDRTFSLYRLHFLLFIGIAAIPNLFVLAVQLLFGPASTTRGFRSVGLTVGYTLVILLISLVAYLFSQGATILAVTDLYLGRAASISTSLKRVWTDFGSLLGVVLLNGLAIGVATLLLIIPGIYVACRLLVCLPAALIEKRGPRESLSRSFDLTRENAGRAFVILLIFTVIGMAFGALIGFTFGYAIIMARANPGMIRLWTALMQVAQSLLNIVISPVLLIATSVFYFDLRVRKEAFDLQFMMDPTSERITGPQSGSAPSILP